MATLLGTKENRFERLYVEAKDGETKITVSILVETSKTGGLLALEQKVVTRALADKVMLLLSKETPYFSTPLSKIKVR